MNTRLLRTEFSDPHGDALPLTVGCVGYLIYTEYHAGSTRHRDGKRNYYYKLVERMPRTNRGIERPKGWLGTTNNIYRESQGYVRVVKLNTRSVYVEPTT